MDPISNKKVSASAPMVGTDSPVAETKQQFDKRPAFPTGDVTALGPEGMIAMLVAKNCQDTAQLARQLRRSDREAQIAALRAQASAMFEKADHLASQAMWSATLTIAGGVASGAGGFMQAGDKASKLGAVLSAGGGASSGLATPVGTLNGGKQAAYCDAAASAHGTTAKLYEGAADEAAALEKQVEQVAQKALAALQQFLDDRRATRAAILRI